MMSLRQHLLCFSLEDDFEFRPLIAVDFYLAPELSYQAHHQFEPQRFALEGIYFRWNTPPIIPYSES